MPCLQTVVSHHLKRSVSWSSTSNPEADAFEESAAICEHDGGMTHNASEDLAAQCRGYDNVVAFRAALMDKRMPTK
jgi:hypothetical protein